jgi:hypothetical protein
MFIGKLRHYVLDCLFPASHRRDIQGWAGGALTPEDAMQSLLWVKLDEEVLVAKLLYLQAELLNLR